MHVFLAIFTILILWLRGDYKHWQKYHTTMLYYAVGNLAYNFICANYLLWRLNPDFLSNHSQTEMLYTFIVFPATALMFLARYPNTWKRKLLHYATWISLYLSLELVFIWLGKIEYQYGWNFWWSVFLVIIMFPMFRLHHTRPLLTYILSVPITIFLMYVFDVPFDVPIENRPGVEGKPD